MPTCIQVVTLVGARSEADQIAGRLVAGRLAACVQILGPVSSTYHWQDRVERNEEWMCLIKTTVERYPAVELAIRELHSYQMPEIAATPIVAGSPEYLAWVRAETAVREDSA